MVIYDIRDNKIIDAVLTEGAEHEEELGKANLVRLSWDCDVKITIPAGSYIIPFDDGLRYRLLNSYTPTEDSKCFKYTPEFHHPLMLLGRISFLYVTKDAGGNDIKQQEWSFDGLTVTALEYVCKSINEAFGIKDETEKFTYTLCGTVDASVSFSVSSNDILSALSSIAQACKDNACEWHLSWEHRALYFGQISINLGEEVPVLKVHDNIQYASVNESRENYYNCFYPQGSTKNMSRKALVGTGNVATLARLGLDKDKYPDGCIYIDTEGKVITKAEFEASNAIRQTLALSFDDIFPHIDLYAYNIRKRTRWQKNDTTGEYEKNPDGTNKAYTVWYMRLAYCTTTKDASKSLINTTADSDEQGNAVTHYWYDYDIDKRKQVLQGYTLKGAFKVNTHATDNQYDALSQHLVGQPSGQDGFVLDYHDEESHSLSTVPSTGDSGVSILKGDYEIKMYQSGDTIIPTNEEDGLIPHGKPLPDLTCNIVVLFNIVMGDSETKTAQEELATRAVKEIKRRSQDNNNYSAASNPVAFAKRNPGLYIGQEVTFDDGQGYRLPTRVIKLVTKLDYPIIQDITVGNQAIKGTITQLKEDVNNILSGNFSGGGLNNAQVSDIVRNYTDTRFLSKVSHDTAQKLITFLEGIAFKNGKGIDGDGNATLRSLELDNASIDQAGHALLESVKSPDFKDGGTLLDGTGFGLWKDKAGRTHVAADIFEARRKVYFAELEVRKFIFSSGDTGYTRAGCRIDVVRKLPSGDYRCFFLAEDDDVRISNDFHVGDQAMARTGNIISKSTQMAQNRYYWRLVVAVDDAPVELEDGRKYHYIDLSDTRGTVTLTIADKDYLCVGCDTSVENDEPLAGDKLVQLGSQTDDTRQYAYIVYVSTGQRVDYNGINDYDLGSHAFVNISKRGIELNADYLHMTHGGTGQPVNIVNERGAWYQGAVSGHYDRWSHDNATWLCNIEKGKTTTSEPRDGSPEWIKETYGKDAVNMQILTDTGNFIRNGHGRVTLTARVTRGGSDITSQFQAEDFSWMRNSGNEEYDGEWNNRHKGVGNVIVVKAEDIWKKSLFECVLNDI